MKVEFGEMLRLATIMADRLATRRSARPIIFLSDQPSELMPILLRIGEQCYSKGHHIIIVNDHSDVEARIECLSRDRVCESRLRLFLISDIHELDRHILARLLDSLHLAARDCLPTGCIATGSPETPRLVGELRSFAERLIEFRRASVSRNE